MLISTWMDDNAVRDPDGVALALPDRSVSHEQLRAATVVAACRLRAAGVRRGDHVGILLAASAPTTWRTRMAPRDWAPSPSASTLASSRAS